MRLLTPIPPDRRPRRFTQLLVGLLLYGFTMGLMVRAVLGLDPWDVFHLGLTELVGRWVPLSYGTVITIVSVLVLLLWIPLRQRPGVGTIANAAIIGFATDATLRLVPPVDSLTVRIGLLVAAVVGNALAGALYIGAGLGPGPRDGLMTGLVARGIGTIRLVRTAIELTVLAIGWLLGGVVGVGTVAYALAIGPLLHILLPKVQVTATTTGTAAGDQAELSAAAEPAGTAVEGPFVEAEGR
ncbi:MAG TPA: hypothetical protein VIU11_04195 [Nakamurella sp.]